MQVLEENKKQDFKVVVYNVPSSMDCIFKYETLRIYSWNSNMEETRKYLQDDLDTWTKRLEESIKDGNWEKRWLQQIKHYIKQAKRGLETMRIINYSQIDEEERKLLCNKVEEISEELYEDMLEVLPPIFKKGCRGFLMSEFTTGNITSQFWKDGNKYYHAFVDVKDKSTWN